MSNQSSSQTGAITETIRGIVDRVTYHNPDNGWSVLRVLPFNNPPVSRPVKLFVALKFVDDYSLIQIWGATIDPGIIARILKKVLAQPFNFYVEQLAENIFGNMNISGKEKNESYRIQRQCS